MRQCWFSLTGDGVASILCLSICWVWLWVESDRLPEGHAIVPGSAIRCRRHFRGTAGRCRKSYQSYRSGHRHRLPADDQQCGCRASGATNLWLGCARAPQRLSSPVIWRSGLDRPAVKVHVDRLQSTRLRLFVESVLGWLVTMERDYRRGNRPQRRGDLGDWRLHVLLALVASHRSADGATPVQRIWDTRHVFPRRSRRRMQRHDELIRSFAVGERFPQ